MIDSLLVVGRGALGSLVTRILRARGVRVTTTRGRDPSPRAVADATTLLLAVPDPAIASVTTAVAPSLRRGAVVLHAAGSLSSEVLSPARLAGAHVGVAHPLVSFARSARPSGFDGAICVVAGDRRAIARAKSFAQLLGTTPVVADVHGPTYHAAAALAANGAVALVNEAARLLVSLGFSSREAELGLAGILGTVVANVRQVGVPEALTGPIARGDAATVARHRAAIGGDARALAAYDGIAPAILACSVERGLGPGDARAIRTALDAPIPPRRTAAQARRSTRGSSRPRR